MKKPEKKTMHAIMWSWESPYQGNDTRSIGIQTNSKTFLMEMSQFGKLEHFHPTGSQAPGGYIDVDARYDKKEVLEYIRWRCKQSEIKPKPKPLKGISGFGFRSGGLVTRPRPIQRPFMRRPTPTSFKWGDTVDKRLWTCHDCKRIICSFRRDSSLKGRKVGKTYRRKTCQFKISD